MTATNKIIDELVELTRTMSEGTTEGGEFKELNSRLTDALADVAQHIEEIRKNLMDVKPGLEGASKDIPETTGHLGDIDKTLADAADRLFELTEKAVVDNSRGLELINLLKDGGGDSAAIEELTAINAAHSSELMEVMSSLSFQDLAGQKIKKVSGLIEGVETRILKILLVLGYSDTDDAAKQEEMLSNLDESQGELKQNLVDDILKDFGL